MVARPLDFGAEGHGVNELTAHIQVSHRLLESLPPPLPGNSRGKEGLGGPENGLLSLKPEARISFSFWTHAVSCATLFKILYIYTSV